ncbi:MAG: BamA/TamA family outer membrane protein, partial [Bradymonadaceae bacterium]
EGSRSLTRLAYPLWNLDRTWGADLTIAHRDEVVRQFRGSELLRYDNPETVGTESAPYKYRLRTFEVDAHLRYATGQQVEHRLSAGYQFRFQAAELTPDFPADDQIREAFRRDALPPPERNSGPVFGYSMFLPNWQTYRNIDTYELPEERRLGPYLDVNLAPVLEAFGSLNGFVGLSATAGARADLGNRGFGLVEFSAGTRHRDGRFVDTQLTGAIRVAPPPLFETLRFVIRARADRLIDDFQNRLLFAGGRNGLRGYQIGAFEGETRLISNIELRSMAIPVWTMRVGAVGFWDFGHATDRLGDLQLRHDIGVGLRLLIPQANTLPLRADWAFPLSARRSGWPGRISVGFGQAF